MWSYNCSFHEDTSTSAKPRMTPGTSLIPDAPGTRSCRTVVTDANDTRVPGQLFKQRAGFLTDKALTCHQHYRRKEKPSQASHAARRDVNSEKAAGGQGQRALKPGRQSLG